jgi:hypothetical protein
MPLGGKEMSHWIEAHGQESGRAGRSALSLQGNPAGAPRPSRLRVSRRSGRGQGTKSAVVQTEVADRGFAEDTPLGCHRPFAETRELPAYWIGTQHVVTWKRDGETDCSRRRVRPASGPHPGRVHAPCLSRVLRGFDTAASQTTGTPCRWARRPAPARQQRCRETWERLSL